MMCIEDMQESQDKRKSTAGRRHTSTKKYKHKDIHGSKSFTSTSMAIQNNIFPLCNHKEFTGLI